MIFVKRLLMTFMEVDGAGTSSARKRRERRLRSWLRHERMTVALELAAATHHSSPKGGWPDTTHDAPRGQKTASSAGAHPGVLKELEVLVGAVTVGYVAAPVPFLSSPTLADAAAETVDARTVKYFLKAALRRREEEERKEWDMELGRRDEQQRRVAESLEKARAALEPGRGSKRKRKKRRKRRLPRSSVPRGGRACRRQRQWHAPRWFSSVLAVFPSCQQAQVPQHFGWYGPEGHFHGRARYVLAGFAGDDAFRVVFPSVVAWPRCSASWPVWTRRNFSRSCIRAVACARLVLLVLRLALCSLWL